MALERINPQPGETSDITAAPISGRLCLVIGAATVPAISVGVAGVGEAALMGSILGWALLWLAVIDLREFRLPDRITLPLIAAGLLSGLILHPALIWDHAAGAAAGYILFRLIESAFRQVRGYDGLGRGDAKLLAAGGAWVAWYGLPSVVLIASLAGIIQALLAGHLRSRAATKKPLPFGPALALSIWLVWLFGPLQWGGPW